MILFNSIAGVGLRPMKCYSLKGIDRGGQIRKMENLDYECEYLLTELKKLLPFLN